MDLGKKLKKLRRLQEISLKSLRAQYYVSREVPFYLKHVILEGVNLIPIIQYPNILTFVIIV